VDPSCLAERYAGIVFDIDGVLARADQAIPGAGETLAELKRRGVGLSLATNNAARTPTEVAAALSAVGVAVEPEDIVTSAMAAAELLDPGTRCLVIGMAGLHEALAGRGCVAVREPGEAEAVVVGWHRGLVWDDLRRATLALTGGDVRFLATNTDVTYPAPEGLWPGNGAVVTALAAASGRQPDVAGKPYPPLLQAAARRLPDGPLLMVGDRHDTDIVGAAGLGWDTALVLSGVTAPEIVPALEPAPTWVLDDVRGLLAPPPAPPPTPPEPAVRQATAGDVEAIIRLWDEAGMLTYTTEPRRDVAAVLAHDPTLCLVAEAAGEVVGIVLGTSDGRRGWVQRLAVKAPQRRAGLGRLLVGELEQRLSERGVPQVNALIYETNRAGLEFWDRLDYATSDPVVLRTKRLDR
jgi:HAD superfamily hydrolase (TIGR01450 family)